MFAEIPSIDQTIGVFMVGNILREDDTKMIKERPDLFLNAPTFSPSTVDVSIITTEHMRAFNAALANTARVPSYRPALVSEYLRTQLAHKQMQESVRLATAVDRIHAYDYGVGLFVVSNQCYDESADSPSSFERGVVADLVSINFYLSRPMSPAKIKEIAAESAGNFVRFRNSSSQDPTFFTRLDQFRDLILATPDLTAEYSPTFAEGIKNGVEWYKNLYPLTEGVLPPQPKI